MRICNTCGPRTHPIDGRVVSNFIFQALKGRDLTTYGDGRQTRAFCQVDDVIDALLRTMATPEEFTGPVNVGNPAECTMFQLAELILKLVGGPSRLVFQSLPEGDPKQRQPDIALAREALASAPKVRLEDVLKETASYFRHLLRS